MKRLLFWLAGFLPCRIISDDGQPYLERYYIATLFGVRFYLHRFVGSDPARGLHDHPWPWAGSVVLSGWYNEETRQGIKRVRWFNWLTGDSFHRVILPTSCEADARESAAGLVPMCKPCWTMFFHRAKYVKPWGFLNAENPLGFKPPSVYVWKAWDHDKGGDGTATSSDWWHTAPQGRFTKTRQPLHTEGAT
jgi:hypothetical protein